MCVGVSGGGRVGVWIERAPNQPITFQRNPNNNLSPPSIQLWDNKTIKRSPIKVEAISSSSLHRSNPLNQNPEFWFHNLGFSLIHQILIWVEISWNWQRKKWLYRMLSWVRSSKHCWSAIQRRRRYPPPPPLFRSACSASFLRLQPGGRLWSGGTREPSGARLRPMLLFKLKRRTRLMRLRLQASLLWNSSRLPLLTVCISFFFSYHFPIILECDALIDFKICGFRSVFLFLIISEFLVW